MKTIKRLLLALLLVSPVLAETTTNMGMPLPADGDTEWGEKLRTDFRIIDASAAVLPIDLTTGVTGVLPAANVDPNTVYDDEENFFTDTNHFQAVSVSSISVNGPINTNLTANQCVQTGANGLLSVTGAACGSGGGGSSALAVNQNGIQITSPTVAINALSPPFIVTAVGAGTTAQWKLDGSSVTLRGYNVINLQDSLQTGATFYVSSGTVQGQFTANTVNASTMSVSGRTTIDTLRVTGANGLTVDNLTPSQCVQTGAGGLLSTTGSTCGSAPGGSSGQFQYNNGGNFAGTALATVGTSSISFTTVSSATYTGFSNMTMSGMLFDGSTSTMTFSSATIRNLSVGAVSPNLIVTGVTSGASSAFGVSSTLTGTALTNYAGSFTANATGGGNTNYGGYFDASGAGTNHGIYINRGDLSLGGSTGSTGNILTSAGANTVPTWNSTLALSTFNTTSTSTTIYGILEVGDSATGFSGGSRLSFNTGSSPALNLYANNNTAVSNDINFINSSGVTYAALSANPVGGGVTVSKASGLTVSFGVSAATITASGYIQKASKTKAQLALITPTVVGQEYYCSDCSSLLTCISSGTAQGAFASPVSKTTACN